ncbi:hypothetical protein GCM10010208_40500 [Actinomadura livida]|nr:hypothetical protein GCM10010208_40500 [Actinomadura livida]
MGALVMLVIRTTSLTVAPAGASNEKKGRAAGAALRFAGPTDQAPFPVAGPGAAAAPGAAATAAVPVSAAAAARHVATAAAAIRSRGLIDHLVRPGGGARRPAAGLGAVRTA